MKKFLPALLSVLIAPVMLFAGCGEAKNLIKTSTSLSAINFMGTMNATMNDFKSLVNGPEFNISDLKYSGADYDTFVSSFDIITQTNQQALFGLMALDMYNAGNERGYYNLSYLGGNPDDGLENFSLVKDVAASTESQAVYLYKLTGKEKSDFLPTPTPVTPVDNYLDNLDNADVEGVNIAEWGNWLRFTVKVSNITTVNIEPIFIYPTAEEVPEVYNETSGFQVMREADKKRITVVYKVGEVTYSKRVTFVTDEATKTTTKEVNYYVGNILDPALGDAIARNYSYTLQAKSETLYLMGKYDFNFDQANSNIYCKTPGKLETKRVSLEIYRMHTGEILSRYIKPLDMQLQQVDFVLYPTKVSGSIKTERATNLSFSRIGVDDGFTFDHSYGTITSNDQSSINTIRQYVLANSTAVVKRVN